MSDYDEGFRAGVGAAARLFVGLPGGAHAIQRILALRPPAPEPTMEPALRAPMPMALEGARDADWHGDEAEPSETAAPMVFFDDEARRIGRAIADADPTIQAAKATLARVATERAACPVCEAEWLDAKTPGQVWSKMKQALVPCPKCGTGRARGGAK